MNMLEIITRFSTEESCFEYLEKARWQGEPECPHCQSKQVGKRNEAKIVGRWNCYECKASFRVIYNTLFHNTKVPLQKWFMAISFMDGAGKSISSSQLARNVKLNQKTAWYMMQRIREEMEKKDNGILKSIIEDKVS